MSNSEEYEDWTDQELSDELNALDNDIELWQKSMAATKRMLNSATETRDEILDIVKQRGQKRGWQR